MIIGYARTSTVDQDAGLEAQMRDLRAAGCEKLFQEQVSSVGERAQLNTALQFAREGDVFVVTKIDRLARSIGALCELQVHLKSRGIGLRILNLGLDTGSPTGQLILNVLGSVAQFEREMMLERQREGIAKAKSEGKYRGRAPKARRQAARIMEMKAEGKSGSAIAGELGISERSVWRVIQEAVERDPRAARVIQEAARPILGRI